MILIVGGLGNTRRYFTPFMSCLSKRNISVELYILNPYYTLLEHRASLSKKVNNISTHITIVAFSLGCLIVIDCIPLFNHHDFKITLINPSNLFVDFGLDHSNYYGNRFIHYKSLTNTSNIFSINLKSFFLRANIIFSLNKYVQRLLTSGYMFMIGNSLEEPDFLLLDILNYDLIGLQQCIENCGLKLNWYESLKKLSVSNVKKINIISGNKDRYLPFSKLLSEQFSNIFSLKVIDGQHHIIYTYPYEVSLLI